MTPPPPPTRSRSRRIACAALCLLAGCGQDSEPAGAGAGGPTEARSGARPDTSQAEVEQALVDLVAAVTPLPATASVGAQNDWFSNRKTTLERLRRADEEVGRRALAEYHRRSDSLIEIRAGLLDVAAHTDPEGCRELLVALITEFGEDLLLRANACGLLAAGSARTAVDTIEPVLLERRRRTRTYPPEDKMLAAWLSAKRGLQEDPAEVLAAVATDLHQFAEARHLATRELAGTTDPRGRRALEEILVETGNGYLRRLAVQSLVVTIPTDQLCALLQSIVGNEADVAFQIFLANVIDRDCR